MAIATKSYNPGFLTDGELKELFCVRTGEFESLIETLRDNTGSSNQHAIVVGPRGSGKTTLLLRVALELRSDPDLSSRLYPIVFAEESYGVGTCGEFWLECLSRLAQQEPRRNGDADLQRTFEDVRREQHDRFLAERCLGALLEFADREGKRLVLEVENLDMMFSDMMDPDVGWCLRKTLQTEPRIMMIGSAACRFGEIERPDRALYDLFRILSLRPLNRKESALLCERVSGQPVEPGAARRLQILTGGSPRLLAIMARFGAARSFGTLMSDLLDVVDEHTAYFKSHLESLPPQERRVYLALATLWKPATAREVAEHARMETSKCSAQLRRLIGRGVVSNAGGTSHRKQYYVSERLYNIYYLLRRSRGTDSLVGALVEFMDAYYSRPELEEPVDQMVVSVDGVGPRTRSVYEAALRHLSGLPDLAWKFFNKHPDYVSSEVKELTEETSAILNRGGLRFARGDLAGALDAADNLVNNYGTIEATTVREMVLRAWVNKGTILALMQRHEEAIKAFDHAVGSFQSSGSRELHFVLATALSNKVALLEKMGRREHAVAACDELMDRFGRASSPEVLGVVARAHLDRGVMLGKLGRVQAELDAYQELKRRFGSSRSTCVLLTVAQAHVNEAARLARAGQLLEGIAVCDELTARFGDSGSIQLLDAVVRGLIIKSVSLGRLGRIEEQVAACNDALSRLERDGRLTQSDESSDHSDDDRLLVRLSALEVRATAHANQGNRPATERDVRTILKMLPGLANLPGGTVAVLTSLCLVVGVDRMAYLICESPSAHHLRPLTTALQLEMGLQPRVSIEVQQVAEDIRRDLSRVRQTQGLSSRP